nr:alginate lyase family protein [Holdemania massiliensis]
MYSTESDRIARKLNIERKEAGAYIKANSVCSLLTTDIEKAIAYLRKSKRFNDTLKNAADAALNHKFLLLNTYADELYDDIGNGVKWYTDYESGYTFGKFHYSDSHYTHKPTGVEIKNVWELSRMQYLFAPALYYKIHGDERYAIFVKETILNWMDNNDWETGPNWHPSMETGIRIANILLSYQLILNSSVADTEFCACVASCASLHQKFIMQNVENIGGVTSNHYLGGLVGLAVIATTFPFLPGEKSFLANVYKSFEKEIRRQILEDGTGFEGSSQYLQFVGEMFCVPMILRRNTDGTQFSSEYQNRLFTALNYIRALHLPDNTWCQIGDNDSGHIFRLSQTKSPDASYFIRMAETILGQASTMDTIPSELVIFCENVTDRMQSEISDNIYFFDKGYNSTFRSHLFYLNFAAPDPFLYGMNSHTHNDKLSFILCYLDKPFIIDPGTGSYTGNTVVRNRLRSIESHSTVQINHLEQNDFFMGNSMFASIRKVYIKEWGKKQENNICKFSGSIEYADVLSKYIHDREIEIDNNHVEIDDTITGDNIVSVISRLVLHPDVNVYISDDSIFMNNSDVCLRVETNGIARVTEGLYSMDYGKWETTNIIEIEHLVQNSHCVLCKTIIYPNMN